MSIRATLDTLKTLLATVDPSPQPAPKRIYADPSEAVSLGDLPAIILAEAPEMEHTFRRLAFGGHMRHDYTIAMFVLVGTRQTGLPELHARALPWPEAIATVLSGYAHSSGNGAFVIGADPDVVFRYRSGPISWGDGEYWGLRVLLPVWEDKCYGS